ncbi:MAG: hypothetical protein ACK4M1_10775 [Flavobacterium sp.]
MSNNPQANAFASRIVNMMNANTEANPFNSSVSMVGDSLGYVTPILGGLQFLGQKLEIPGTSKLGLYGFIYDVVGLGVNLYRSSADHSGKTVSYDVDKDGKMIKK